MKLSNEMREMIDAARGLREASDEYQIYGEPELLTLVLKASSRVIDALDKWEQLP